MKKNKKESSFFPYLKSITREAFSSIKRNNLMGLASVLSILAALIILGIFIVFSVNLQHITQNVESALELKVYLKKDITQEQIDSLQSQLQSNEYVTEVTYVSADQALSDFSSSLQEYSGLLQGYDSSNNPMQASFNLKVSDPDRIKDVKTYAEGLQNEGVDSVKYGEEYVDALTSFSHFANIFSIALIVILSVVSIFIIYNTIKLTCFARRKEIRVMRYVGAANWYIRAPFVLEGVIFGLIAALIAIILIRANYYFLISYVQQSIYLPMNSDLVDPNSIMGPITLFSFIYGIAIGAVGSVFSMRKFLNV